MNISCWQKVILSLFWLCIAFCLPLFSEMANATETENPFHVSVENATRLCEENEKTCKIWILGIIDGMELTYTLISPADQLSKRPSVFCFPDGLDHIDQLYKGLIEMAHSPEVKNVKNMQNQPGLLILLTPGLDKYLCPR